MAKVSMVSPSGSGVIQPAGSSTPNVSYIRSEVTALRKKWDPMRIVLQGEMAVKEAGVRFLPMPSTVQTDVDAVERYRIYKERATFYNVTRRTLDGLMGQVFSRDPICVLPSDMSAMMEDVDGAGVSIHQQTRMALSFVMAYGRCGMLSDYPNLSSPATRQQIADGTIRPMVQLYDPWSIINWRTRMVDGRRLLSLVVISENYLTNDDGFESNYSQQWRVLRLDASNEYQVEIWRKDSPNDNAMLYQTYTPKDSKGMPFKFIPFTFVGCSNNNEYPDDPPLFDLMTINIGHYRNSADYEESCFIAGQPTPVFTGLTESWVENVLQGKAYLGSRGGIPLPSGATASLMQAQPNSMPFEAMGHKEAQMTAMGAKLVEQKSVQRTLGESQQDEASESSILATAAKNVSMAMMMSLRYAALFQGSPWGEIIYDLNTDFPAARMSPNERAELVLEWNEGLISYSEARAALRKTGVATLDDKVAQAESEANPSPEMKLKIEAAATAKLTAENGPATSAAAPTSKTKKAVKGNNQNSGPKTGDNA